ncbi:MAG: malto-oligosyltrehalose trehalohydrolase [Deltaproteobacteria bacterium HGW-Deltaproteobacteria-4]|nr:MAG: malto-oligosyltrehalose trehalohydrolase [Deltaproteobacteria bacterium HGW-Deltaproteobacteria-4]
MRSFSFDIGATPVPGGVNFRVWAPAATCVEVEILSTAGRKFVLQRDGDYFQGVVVAAVGDDYWYWLDNTLRRPDPASRSQPQGVHGPSRIIDPAFPENEGGWAGIALDACIFYELHIGTFTPAGTFDAAIDRLAYLRELGVTALQIMPVAQFPGERNWGYDGVFPFAPQESYGGPAGLKRLVAACHQQGLAVFLDVVYNHLGPEGNYLHAFGPYFTDRYRTPWGDAVNFDGADSDGVRHYFIANACYWLREYHFDGLRLDAVHGIFDFSARHILDELTEAVHALAAELGRPAYVIAESDLNDPRLVIDRRHGGYGLDAQWCDDFHHALRTLLTGDRSGYFRDFGGFSPLVKSFRAGFVMAGDYSSYRRRRHGASSAEIPPRQLLVFAQNHDQVGNRMRGERLSEHLSPPQLKLAAATVLLSPYLPLLFMGEEYAERAPFPYFISHGDAELVAAVRQGRNDEFLQFAWQGHPPDPQAESTFLSAKVDPEQRRQGEQRALFDFYGELIRLRKECRPLAKLDREGMEIVAGEEEQLLAITRSAGDEQILCLFNYSERPRLVAPPLAMGTLTLLFDSAGAVLPGRGITVDAARPETFPALPPFGVSVYRKD